MTTPDQVRPLLVSALQGSGLVLDDVTVTPAGRRRVVRVVVDRPVPEEGDVTTPVQPLSLDEVAEASRAVGSALDGADVLGQQPYTLEVTSPGVGRPLTQPRHFRRNVGRLLSLQPREGEAVTGRLVRAGTDDLTVEVTGRRGLTLTETHPYAGLSRAEVQVEFTRAGDGGAGEEPDPGEEG